MENMKYCPVHKTYHRECHNPNHNHSHNHNHKNYFYIRKNRLSKSYIIIFILSIVLLILISLLSLILSIYNINYPRIFFPIIIAYIGSFICGGGIIGSYGPIDNQELNYIYMRKCSSAVMFFICVISFSFFLFQNINFFISVKDAKNFCLENDFKSKGDFYLELIGEKQKLNSLLNNFEQIYKNGLTCFEKQKCVKSILDSDSFICNYNYEENMKENVKCKKIFEAEHLLINIEDSNIANFVSSCLELKNDNIKSGKELYKCSSYLNLCKDDSFNNEEENKEIEKYYDNKNIIYKNKIIEIEKKIKLNKIGNYSYENKCLMNFSYNIILFSTILHILFSSGICITWAFLGIFSILKSFGIIEDSEKKYYYDMIERANKIYEQVNNNSKESKNIPEENVPLNVDVK